MNKDDNVRREFWRRIIITTLEIAAIIFLVWMIVLAGQSLGISEAFAEDDVTEAYIICSDFVYARPSPNNDGDPLGRFEPGDSILLDGKKRNGYYHVVDLKFEACEGWVHKGFVVFDKPIRVNQTATIVSKGRLAARKYVGGKRTRWLKPLASLKVYWWSDDWCVTDCGYVQTKYLELEGV